MSQLQSQLVQGDNRELIITAYKINGLDADSLLQPVATERETVEQLVTLSDSEELICCSFGQAKAKTGKELL